MERYVGEQIRNEVLRFESVHPCIYSVYDLLDLVENVDLREQIREQVVAVEGSEHNHAAI